MSVSINDCLHELERASSAPPIAEILQDFLTPRGVESFLFYDAGSPLAVSRLIHNVDRGVTSLIDARNAWRSDPLGLHSRTRPVIWHAASDDDETRQARELVWEPLTDAGFRHLIAVPIHGPGGRCNAFSAIATGWRSPAARVDRILNELILIAYTLEGVFRSGAAATGPSLTPRERECLDWTARGKTAWEIGRILGITERTANFHLQNATRKMGERSKYGAVGEAVRRGLVSAYS